jgi:serine/threonine protein kinase/Tol biopolymer transport system component
MIGQTISHYRIIEKLGGGGMGVVYKAQDTKLDRFVALKFLPLEMTLDPVAKERFVHEAKAASALQHNNICTVHDIDESPDGQMFIVMDCYEGETLKSRIAKGKLRIEEAADIAIQIAQGLSEAHTHGIVHRDVKPANVLVTKGGVAKIVDFGLAKLSGATKLTKTGSTPGTVAYMAPEQLQGSAVDARADIFSLGVVLYEMLTGKTPFRGDHEAALMYSIMNEEPEPLQTHIPDVSSELIHIVSRALEKDPANRYKTMDDVLIDLQRIKRDTSKVFGTATYSSKRHRYFKKRRAVVGVASLLLIVVATLATLFILRNRTPRLNLNRTTATLKIPLREFGLADLSRDGNWLVLGAADENGKGDIYWINIAGGKATRVTNENADRIRGMYVSPDASQIVYSCQNFADPVFKVKLVPTQGGENRTVVDTGVVQSWRPDGQRIGYMLNNDQIFQSASGKLEIWSVKPDGSDRRLEHIDSLCARPTPWSFCWSPDGGSVAWVRNYAEGYGEVMVRELATGKERQLTHDRKWADELIWATNNQILFVSNKSGQLNLWMIPAGGGEETQITQGAVPIYSPRISDDNRTLVYAQWERFRHIWISSVDGSNARPIKTDDIMVPYACFSPDGKHIAHVIADVDISNPQSHLYVMDRDGKNERQLTSGPEVVSGCRWSLDGKLLAYTSRLADESTDSSRIYLIQPVNPGAPRLLGKGGLVDWADNETVVAFYGMKTLRYSMNGGTPTQIYLDSTSAFPMRGKKQLYFLDFRKGREGRWVISVDAMGRLTGEPKKILPLSVMRIVATSDRRFLYRKKGDEIWRMWTSTGKEERIGKAPPRLWIWDVSTDGKEILWYRQYDPSKIVLVKNVFE